MSFKTYREKSETIKAKQWFPSIKIRGVFKDDFNYYFKTKIGRLVIQPGWWVIKRRKESVTCSNEEFKSKYEVL